MEMYLGKIHVQRCGHAILHVFRSLGVKGSVNLQSKV